MILSKEVYKKMKPANELTALFSTTLGLKEISSRMDKERDQPNSLPSIKVPEEIMTLLGNRSHF